MSIDLPSSSPLSKPIQFGAKADPKASKMKYRNIRSAAIALAALGGAMQLDDGVSAVRNYTEDRVELSAEGSSDDDFLNEGIDQLAEIETSIRDTRFVTGAQNQYVWGMRFELLVLALIALKGARKKTIDPKDIYKELNDRGITGKNVKVGVIDSGYKANRIFNKPKLTHFKPSSIEQPAKNSDPLGHGTAVTNLIARGLPDAAFINIAYGEKADNKRMQKEINKILKAAKKDPKNLDINDIRRAFTPMIENIAKALVKSVDEGADVVNVSLSVEQGVKMMIMINLYMQAVMIGGSFVKSKFTGDRSSLKERMKYLSALDNVMDANNKNDKVTDELKAIYQPWLDALDYAHSENVPVVLAAGNSNGHKNVAPDNIGHLNLLALIDHPALIMVGSTNEAGEVSKFTSEANDIVQPLMALNGSGEVDTDIRRPDTGWVKRLIAPFGRLVAHEKYRNPPGTSFAAPDGALMIAAGMDARAKAGKVELSIEDLKELIVASVEPAHFNPKVLPKIEKEITARLKLNNITIKLKDGETLNIKHVRQALKDAKKEIAAKDSQTDAMKNELDAELSRRVGHGTLVGKRLEVIENIEQA